MKGLIKNQKLKQAISAAPFFASAFDYFDNLKILMAIFCLIVAVINIVASRYILKHLYTTKILLFLVNSALSIFIALDYYNSGSQYLHFAWFFVAFLFIIAAIRNYIKLKKNPQNIQI